MLADIFAKVFPVQYRKYIESAKWRTKAAAARKRAGYRCQMCGRALPLQVHHNTYKRLGYELPRDLIALCDDCHRRHHHLKG
jgi:5-methylcytosine-specific restriction endonuclease McrA